MNHSYEMEVSRDYLMEYTKNIAQWERVAGTDGELQAFHYLEQQLIKFGANTHLYSHDAFISVPQSAALQVAGQHFSCQTHSMATSTGDDGIQRTLVYGGKSADLTASICKDNIVLLEGRAEREPIIKAHQLGAAGVICISGDYIYESCISPIWGSPSHMNKHLLPCIPVVSITTTTGKQIKDLLASSSPLAHLQTKVNSSWRKIPLLKAEISSFQPTDKFVMFSGHVDSWYHGAMDNGTANATMMEVGRIAGQHREALQHNLRLVFFSGHSQGRYAGSSWYCDHFWEDLHQNCIVSINIDSVGAIGANDLTRSTIMPEAKGVAIEVIKENTGVDFVGRRYSRFADQSFWGVGASCAFASFSKQMLGNRQRVGNFSIPAGGSLDLGWWWHTPEDKIDKIDPDNLVRDAKIFTTYIMRFLTSKIIPLDFRAAAIEIIGILKDWQSKAGEHFDLTEALQRAEQLLLELNELYQYAPGEETGTVEEIEVFNQTLWNIGRILVPLNFTQGCIYENDPAVAQPPMPSLSAINQLAAATDDERKEIRVALVRRRNYVIHSLSRALKVLGNAKEF